LSLGVGGFICVFNQWDWCVGKGDVVMEHASLLSFQNCYLIIGLGEICHYCAT
jgi:hypothetical protein